MRSAVPFILIPVLATGLQAQAALSSDLWRVAAGARVQPTALANSEGTGAMWTPAAHIADGAPFIRIGVEAVHTPSEIGVGGGIIGASVRVARLGTLALAYGRIGIDDVVRTETSPEAVGGAIPIYAQQSSIGLARQVARELVAGAAVRVASGRLDERTHDHVGVDLGFVYSGVPGMRLGAATRLMDPTFGGRDDGASYDLGAEYRLSPFSRIDGVGVLLRYGTSFLRGEGQQHLVSAGLALGRTLSLDVGTARESVAGETQWRSRFVLGLGADGYRVQVARDGGLNGFGATLGFALTAEIR